jgi:hypothetical protein
MTFTIRYLQDGKLDCRRDRAITMYDARKIARLVRQENGFHTAVILATATSGMEKEIEVIRSEH